MKEALKILDKYGIDDYHWRPEIAKEIHEHYMKFMEDIYKNGWFVKRGISCEELPFEEQYDSWLKLLIKENEI